eukprot:jgi/Ulvmu1/3759/UM175_0006.1
MRRWPWSTWVMQVMGYLTISMQLFISVLVSAQPLTQPAWSLLVPQRDEAALDSHVLPAMHRASQGMPHSLRRLQQAADTVEVAVVETAEDLWEAVAKGAPHIELRQHLDITSLRDPDSEKHSSLPVAKLPQVKSIRGRCSGPRPAELTDTLPPLPPLLSPLPSQCLVVANGTFLQQIGELWLDNLYIRNIYDKLDSGTLVIRAAPGDSDSGKQVSSLYMTGVTVQGHGNNTSWLYVEQMAYAQGCIFSDGGGEPSEGYKGTIPALIDGSAAFFDCTFRNSGGVFTTVNSPFSHVLGARDSSTAVRLESCLFRGNPVDYPLVRNNASSTIYADDPSLVIWDSFSNTTASVQPLASVPARPLFLEADDRWFQETQGELANLPASAYVPASEISVQSTDDSPAAATASEVDGDSDDDDSNSGLITAVVVCMVVLLVLVGVLLGLCLWRRQKRKQMLTKSTAQGVQGENRPWHPNGGHLHATTTASTVSADTKASERPSALPLTMPPSGMAHQGTTATASTISSFGMAPGIRPGMRDAAASNNLSMRSASASGTVTAITRMGWNDWETAAEEARTSLEALEVALDALFGMQAPFYGRYLLLSAVDRRCGGQGLVQFANIIHTPDRAAVKFYIDQKAFERERELYAESQLKSMMPATLAIEDNAAGDTCTPYGYKFPPFVIIECGQSLDEWARDNANKDFITIFQALSHAVRALRRLHDFGYAHRDVKPGNILRRPKQHDWTLIDFGCTSRIGSMSSLSFSMKYAAPEVVHALEAGDKTIKVDPAVDIWAIGVIAFELLTGERAFPAVNYGDDTEQPAQEAIAGRALLPWEGSDGPTAERLEKLRGLRRTVLRCLDREPAKRPSAAALVNSWDYTFDNMQTRGTDWSAGSGSMPPGPA